jgi:DNA-binding NarL/FixJ family response regulator
MRTSAKQAKRIRVLLVDDHPLVRDALRDVIRRERDLTVCGEAESREAALAVAAASRPDLAIVDLKLKNSDGLDLVKEIHDRHPKTFTLILSMHDELLHAKRALRAGAHGYISKQEGPDKIMHAIRKVLDGKIYLSERVAQHMAAKLARPLAGKKELPPEILSECELKVFELIGAGYSTSQIAAFLHISLSTVETYRVRIKEKLVLKDAVELRQEAIRWHVAQAAG